ncbi:MAG: hypothetical protein JWO67_3898 [Streptosporangiaceae bacterium]|jgi:hypothetical protein|nr:hypothetical protein [Streptosporangiaceae bacterium]
MLRFCGQERPSPFGSSPEKVVTVKFWAVLGEAANRCNSDYVATNEATKELRGWLSGRLPAEWFQGGADVVLDREEVSVIGRLSTPQLAADLPDAERAAAVTGRIQRFREETRDRRMDIAREAEHKFGRRLSWGVECGGEREMFTTLSVPVMTRLRQSERRILDTLVEAGVARSRSDALAWCVRLVGRNADEWLGELREALQHVERARAAGPQM